MTMEENIEFIKREISNFNNKYECKLDVESEDLGVTLKGVPQYTVQTRIVK